MLREDSDLQSHLSDGRHSGNRLKKRINGVQECISKAVFSQRCNYVRVKLVEWLILFLILCSEKVKVIEVHGYRGMLPNDLLDVVIRSSLTVGKCDFTDRPPYLKREIYESGFTFSENNSLKSIIHCIYKFEIDSFNCARFSLKISLSEKYEWRCLKRVTRSFPSP